MTFSTLASRVEVDVAEAFEAGKNDSEEIGTRTPHNAVVLGKLADSLPRFVVRSGTPAKDTNSGLPWCSQSVSAALRHWYPDHKASQGIEPTLWNRILLLSIPVGPALGTEKIVSNPLGLQGVPDPLWLSLNLLSPGLGHGVLG